MIFDEDTSKLKDLTLEILNEIVLNSLIEKFRGNFDTLIHLVIVIHLSHENCIRMHFWESTINKSIAWIDFNQERRKFNVNGRFKQLYRPLERKNQIVVLWYTVTHPCKLRQLVKNVFLLFYGIKIVSNMLHWLTIVISINLKPITMVDVGIDFQWG